MLPDIRALVAAVVTAAGLLMISFGLVATFRVAQEHRSGSLQADLAQRGRSPVPVYTEPRTILIAEAPAPEPRAPAPVVESAAPEMASLTPVAETNEAPGTAAEAIEAPVEPVMLAAPPPEPPTPSPAAEPAIGGPLEITAIHGEPRDTATASETSAHEKTTKKAAAKKARAMRLARERRAAARRAAQARRENPSAPFGDFGSFKQ